MVKFVEYNRPKWYIGVTLWSHEQIYVSSISMIIYCNLDHRVINVQLITKALSTDKQIGTTLVVFFFFTAIALTRYLISQIWKANKISQIENNENKSESRYLLKNLLDTLYPENWCCNNKIIYIVPLYSILVLYYPCLQSVYSLV